MPNRPPLIDCHLHLQDAAMAHDLESALARAAAVGVEHFVSNGTSPDDWPALARLARTHRGIVPCFGLHPWYAAGAREDWPSILETFLDSMPSAVGEIGLDRWLEPRDEAAQESAFRTQLAVARRRNLPVTIHCLRAWGWLTDVLADEADLPRGMLIHAYGGPVELIAPLQKQGAYFSFAGNVLEARKVKAREALAAVPRDRLLIETDSPDLPPPEGFGTHLQTMPGGRHRNEPANLPDILRGIADVRHEKPADLATAIGENARRFFGELIA